MTKSILITGASSGIGAATAKLFLAEGWTVGLMARRADALAQVADGQPGAHILPGDVTDPGDAERVTRSFAETAGRLDVLFNNAGIFVPAAPIDRTDVADWDRAVAVNLTGMFLMARAAFAQMREQRGGRIVNNGSISAHVPRPGAVSYTVTKHAITGLTKQLALDGRDHARRLVGAELEARGHVPQRRRGEQVGQRNLDAEPVLHVQEHAHAGGARRRQPR